MLKLHDITAGRHDLFQNNSNTQFNYTLMTIRKDDLRKEKQEI
jgi:hypothetical protein